MRTQLIVIFAEGFDEDSGVLKVDKFVFVEALDGRIAGITRRIISVALKVRALQAICEDL